MNTLHLHGTRRPSIGSLALSCLGAAVMLAGCSSGPSSRVVSEPPPAGPPATTAAVVVPQNQTTTTTTTVPAPATAPAPTIVVQQAPPAVQHESAPARPSESHVWIAGYWGWENDRYVWIPGQWMVPPRGGADWVPPRWEREGSGYRFYDGYWD